MGHAGCSGGLTVSFTTAINIHIFLPQIWETDGCEPSGNQCSTSQLVLWDALAVIVGLDVVQDGPLSGYYSLTGEKRLPGFIVRRRPQTISRFMMTMTDRSWKLHQHIK